MKLMNSILQFANSYFSGVLIYHGNINAILQYCVTGLVKQAVQQIQEFEDRP